MNKERQVLFLVSLPLQCYSQITVLRMRMRRYLCTFATYLSSLYKTEESLIKVMFMLAWSYIICNILIAFYVTFYKEKRSI